MWFSPFQQENAHMAKPLNMDNGSMALLWLRNFQSQVLQVKDKLSSTAESLIAVDACK